MTVPSGGWLPALLWASDRSGIPLFPTPERSPWITHGVGWRVDRSNRRLASFRLPQLDHALWPRRQEVISALSQGRKRCGPGPTLQMPGAFTGILPPLSIDRTALANNPERNLESRRSVGKGYHVS